MDGYRIVLIGEVNPRDGWSLELDRQEGDELEQLAEVFKDDASSEFTVRFFTKDSIPLEAVQWLLSEASRRLGAP